CGVVLLRLVSTVPADTFHAFTESIKVRAKRQFPQKTTKNLDRKMADRNMGNGNRCIRRGRIYLVSIFLSLILLSKFFSAQCFEHTEPPINLEVVHTQYLLSVTHQ